ncbi:hypothetical protein [Conexibacter arvalis]|uniref:WD40-like Beta Propeller Repeat n=1 Tax=Conexibacter arvalis TaxID=912552 RepID=A0A840IAE0_9ACTN|nr:hypothetical protein [Conexibacter arvalis]MBB4661221.1 hypothetical protein [Conexibacter arvalis]
MTLLLAAGARGEAPPRHLEMVTPPEKGNNDVSSRTGSTQASADGSRVVFRSATPFPGSVGSGLGNVYLGSRTATGWDLATLTPRQAPNATAGQIGAGFDAFTDDLSVGVLHASDPPLTPHAIGGEGTSNIYRATPLDRSPSYALVTAPRVPGLMTMFGTYAGSSRDLRTVVFETVGVPGLTSDAPNDLGSQAYAWTASEGLRYVGVLPDGSSSTTGATVGLGAMAGNATQPPFAVSDDGDSVLVTTGNATGAGGRLYRWRSDGPTEELSRSRRTPPDAITRPARFEVAAADHSKIFFSSQERLTDNAVARGGRGARADLYLYEPMFDTLTDLTIADPTGGGVLGVLGAAEDGRRIYFVATGALAPGATSGRSNLFVWDEGEGIRFIGVLSDADNWNWRVFDSVKPSRVSRDGRRLLFASDEPQTSYDNAGRRMLYLYDADAGTVACVSCRPDGQQPRSSAGIVTTPGAAQITVQYLPRALSDDGERVFFNTADDLVAEDTNGRVDVYEYSAQGVRLVSTGRGGDDAVFADATPQGDDVFFITRQRISGWDTDDNLDLYAARSSGEPLPEPGLGGSEECEGSACQGPLAPRPASAPFGSLDFVGDDDPVEPVCARRADIRVSTTVRARRRAARSGVLTVTVATPEHGGLAVAARAAVGSRGASRVIGSVRRPPDDASERQIRVRLSRAARKRLAKQRRLRISIRVTLRGCDVSRTTSVLVARTAPRSGRSPARGGRRGR